MLGILVRKNRQNVRKSLNSLNSPFCPYHRNRSRELSKGWEVELEMKWIVAWREGGKVSIAQEEFSRRELASAFQANYAVKSIAPFYPQKPQGNGAFNFTSDMSIRLPPLCDYGLYLQTCFLFSS